MTEIKPQLHQSMLDMMARCGLQFQRRYGHRFGCWHEEEIIPPGTALATGISVHASVDRNLTSKIETGELLSTEEVETVARDTFRGLADKEMRLSDEEAKDSDKAIDDAVDKTIQLATLHHTQLAPSLAPIAVEKPFVIEMVGFPADLAGQIDIIEENVIRDTKTKAQSPPENAARSLQIGMYSMAYKAANGAFPEEAHLDFLVKTKTPKLVTRSIVPTDEMVQPVIFRIERALEVIDAVKSGKRAFAPADPDNWVCTKKFCGWATTCPAWSGK